MVGIANTTNEIAARGEALIVCSTCMNILIVSNAHIGGIIRGDHMPEKDTCVLVYTTCGTCVLMNEVTCDVMEDMIACSMDDMLCVVMLLGYDALMVADPEYLDADLARLIIAPDSGVASASADICNGDIVTARPHKYVSGSFLQH